MCGENCNYSSDGDCDDGGPGSEYGICALGYDCIDCGPRASGSTSPPPPSPSPPPPGGVAGAGTCGEQCNYSSDGDCDDGGPGAEYSICPMGYDCFDCGPRSSLAVFEERGSLPKFKEFSHMKQEEILGKAEKIVAKVQHVH